MSACVDVPSFAKSRRGNSVSVLDAIVCALWRKQGGRSWPALSFSEIREQVSATMGYEVKAPAIRGYIYRRPDIFERAEGVQKSIWRLTRQAQESVG